MAKTKKKAPRLLALVMVTILVFSNFGNAAVAATAKGGSSDCSIASYTATSALTDGDKSDSTQANTQTSLGTESATYSTSLLQSAEWTDKAAGEAELNIHYEAYFTPDPPAQSRSVYVFTTCTSHGFTEDIAIDNIYDLLQYNDYVDAIMIGTINSRTGTDTGNNIIAASKFSLKASDFDLTDKDGTEAKIKTVLETYLNSSADCTGIGACSNGCTENTFADISYAYELGSEGEGNGSVEVLYNDVDFSGGVTNSGRRFYSAAELALTFEGARHTGGYYSLYYLAEYINTIENNYGSDSFSSTVQAVFNSFDAFDTARLNRSGSYDTATLYEKVNEYIGVNLETDYSDAGTGLLSGLTESCSNALEVLQTYHSQGRYVTLVPPNGDFGYNFNNWSYRANAVESYQTQNELLYSLVLMAPSILEENSESAVRSTISGWRSSWVTITIEEDLRTYNENIYAYGSDVASLGVTESLYTRYSVTITTTITSEFEITDTDAIELVNVGDENTSFDYDITSSKDDSGNTVVTITLTDVDNDGASYGDVGVDISIPVKLKDTMEFRTDDSDDSAGWFKDTNAADTTASVSTGSGAAYETVTVASPKLYKALSSLTITKEVTGDATTEQETTDSYSFTVTLTDSNNTALSGTYAAIYTDESVQDTSVSFDSSGQATVSLKAGQSVTISGLPADARYVVTENTTTITGTYEVWINGTQDTSGAPTAEGTIKESETVKVIFSNYFKTGDLIVSKTVSGDDDALTDADKETPFTFEVTASLNGSPLSGTYGDMTFNNGVAEITLAHEETAAATGLPSGTSYTVEELNVDSTTWTTTVVVDDTPYQSGITFVTGEIKEHGTTTVAFTNSKNATTGDLIVSENTATTTGDLVVSKNTTTDDPVISKTSASTLPQTGDSTAALLSLTAALALTAFFVATVSALHIRRYSIRGKHARRS